jgi:hypothetical protein
VAVRVSGSVRSGDDATQHTFGDAIARCHLGKQGTTPALHFRIVEEETQLVNDLPR